MNPIKRRGELTARAQELRKNATRQERHLWYDFLSGYAVRFRRQVVIDTFIADFYCASAKLVIELDGSQHYDEQGLAYDAERTAILESYGITVLRFTNTEIDTDFNAVCERIDTFVKESVSHDQL